ncbi:MAG: DUF3850 domain-containing protein [Patescibacteria group bacterium]
MEIRKKIWKEYFDDVASGRKKFELRLADFDANEGDTLILEEWDKDKKEHTGRKIEAAITYVLKTKNVRFCQQEDVDKHGFQILQIEVKK